MTKFKNNLLEKFSEFVKSFQRLQSDNGQYCDDDEYWYCGKPYENDVNIEISHKEKILRVCCDSNFDMVALLPYEFRFL